MLANILECPSYTSGSRTEEGKAIILSKWIANRDQQVIIAVPALGIGFEYPHVQRVIHMNAPSEMSAFSQESGQSGRDALKASSIVLLHFGGKPQPDWGLLLIGRPCSCT